MKESHDNKAARNDVVLRYHRHMPSNAQGPLRERLVGAGAVVLLGVGHGLHDLFEGDPIVRSFLPTISIALQVIALSVGYTAARRRSWPRWTTVGATLCLSLVFGGLTATLHPWRPSFTLFDAIYATTFSGLGVLGFWLLVFHFPKKLREAQMQTLAAEGVQRKAELALLRSNLRPHFLLNTLNAVAGLVATEPKQARQLVVALGDLLRDSLEDRGELRSLAHETEWLRRYTQIFEIRHRGRVHSEWNLSPETRDVLIPHLLLQPLLENAVEHGVLQRLEGGTVEVCSSYVRGAIVVTVRDDGPGMRAEFSEGLGLRLVRDRLLLAHPDAEMEIDSNDAGTRVTLRLPGTGHSP